MSKSKRKSVLEKERRIRAQKNASNASFKKSVPREMIAEYKGYKQLSINDLPLGVQKQFKEMIDEMDASGSGPAYPYQKPDGSYCILTGAQASGFGRTPP